MSVAVPEISLSQEAAINIRMPAHLQRFPGGNFLRFVISLRLSRSNCMHVKFLKNFNRILNLRKYCFRE